MQTDREEGRVGSLVLIPEWCAIIISIYLYMLVADESSRRRINTPAGRLRLAKRSEPPSSQQYPYQRMKAICGFWSLCSSLVSRATDNHDNYFSRAG
ncbi:hypothetical protein KQX54_005225 [Cotesia glomerata]|uniref:Uncharacterized protein n=1 Tax=Cotesia glomerata TaxID=32391 RepID=A0AAV7HXK0_COTGL|nr:hypothetical protein KQX54_005225 [Cotesia glomerata]